MQMACVEFARNVLGMKTAHSTEMSPNTTEPIIAMMEEQKAITQMGGTMRLGSYDCDLRPGSRVSTIYNSTHIKERHRHRYEFNNAFINDFEEAGMIPAGINPETGLVEIVEVEDHPFFIGTQFHPEYKSTVENPHPLFIAFVKAAKEAQEQRSNAATIILKGSRVEG
jgi:CTP synthase